MVMVIGLFLVVFFIWWILEDADSSKCATVSNGSKMGSREEFNNEVIGLFEAALNYCKCMQHYIDPAYCYFAIGFNKKGTYVTVISMVREEFDKEFGSNLSAECLCDGRLIFVGDKNNLRGYLKKVENFREGCLLVQWYDCSNQYAKESSKGWLDEYIKENYPDYSVSEENSSEYKEIRVDDLLRKYC